MVILRFDARKKMNALIAKYSLSALACCVIFTVSSHAHEFIIKPAALRVNVGDKVPFSVLSPMVFLGGEEFLEANTSKPRLLKAISQWICRSRKTISSRPWMGPQSFKRKARL